MLHTVAVTTCFSAGSDLFSFIFKSPEIRVNKKNKEINKLPLFMKYQLLLPCLKFHWHVHLGQNHQLPESYASQPEGKVCGL